MELRLSSEQLKVISDIFANLGYIFFASAVLPFLVPELVVGKLSLALCGLIIALICWWGSIFLVKDL